MAGGANLIPYLKGIAVTFALIAFVTLYAKLVNILSREKLFYVIVSPFVVFFALFGFMILPNADLLHPTTDTIAALHAAHPASATFINIYACWSYSLFYVLAELWGCIVCTFVFWEFANHIFTLSESKNYYGFFALNANIALMISGGLVYFCSEKIKIFIPAGTDPWHVSTYLLMGIVVIMGILAIYAYRYIYKGMLKDELSIDSEKLSSEKNVTFNKLSLIKSFMNIVSSPQLALIAILIIPYGIAMNLIELQWKEQLKIFYAGDKGGYNGFLGMHALITGISSIFFLSFGIYILRKCTWFVSAVITPIVILVVGSLFFTLIISKDVLHPVLEFFNLKSNAMIVFLGSGIIVISKSVKYALFDPTKEMAYIPLDPELKSTGKAAVDLLIAPLGKAGGACVQTLLFMTFVTKDVVSIAPYAFVLFLSVCIVWIFIVKLLSKSVDSAIS